ncbi:hypothetical protein GCM10025785_10040 [Corynebacterium canis]
MNSAAAGGKVSNPFGGAVPSGIRDGWFAGKGLIRGWCVGLCSVSAVTVKDCEEIAGSARFSLVRTATGEGKDE